MDIFLLKAVVRCFNDILLHLIRQLCCHLPLKGKALIYRLFG
jgi:hypothetical protein